jgi:hypothetical protein
MTHLAVKDLLNRLKYYARNRYRDKIDEHEKTLPYFKKTRSPNHPDLTMFYDNMSTYSKALPFCERAVGIEESVLPSNHPDLQRIST